MKRVRANTQYVFDPVGMDIYYPAHQGLQEGETVKVINLPGCPKANTMNMCHVQAMRDGAWKFLGLVLCASLQPKNVQEY